MTPTEVDRKLTDDFHYFCKNAPLMIKDKQGTIVPLILNQAQRHIHNELEAQKRRLGRVRALILKGRQQGCSTYVGARFYHAAIREPGTNVFILTHEAKATENLFGMVEHYQKEITPALSPVLETENRKRLVYDTKSQYAVATAGAKTTGRSATVKKFHGSEAAYWQHTDDLEAGALQTVSDLDDTEIILESTANGMIGMFYKKAMQARAGIGDYILIFVPWFWQDEYKRDCPPDFALTPEEELLRDTYGLSNEQLNWRRAKIHSFNGRIWLFKQEYPCNVDEAFQTSGDSLMSIESIVNARKSDITDKQAPLVMGVDPATVKDRFSISFRRGREYAMFYAHDCLKNPLTPMEAVGKVAKLIMKHNPKVVFIDMGEGGRYMVDRLKELGFGHKIQGVHFGGKPHDPDQYLNKRVEMYCDARDWLLEGDKSIPDDDSLQADLSCTPDYKLNSSGKMQLIAKDEIRKTYGMSPDIADSLALTFAHPVILDVASKVERVNIHKSGITTLQMRRKLNRG